MILTGALSRNNSCMSHYGWCNFPESIFRLREQGGVSCFGSLVSPGGPRQAGMTLLLPTSAVSTWSSGTLQAPTSGVCKHSWHPCSCCTSETSLGSYGEVPLAPEYMSSQAKDLISRQVPAVRHVTGLLWVSVSRSEHKVVYFALFYL